MPYRTLNPDKIIETAETLQRRISERFPGSGLSGVCRELVDVARASKQRIVVVSRPNWALRVGIALILILGITLLGYVATIIEIKRGTENLFGVLEGIDAAVNTLVLTGAGIFFLATLERRWRRQRALADLHELRTLVHVIDMHQLTKDPSKVSDVSTRTPSSPKRLLTPFELTRYLDYCSEMLSLCAKTAALYPQATKDSLIDSVVSELEQLTANLSGKIWQKITIVQNMTRMDPPRSSKQNTP